MRASPPIEVRLQHDAQWRGFVLAVLGSSCAAVPTWVCTAEAGAALKSAVAVALLIASVAAFPLAWRSDRTLRWTGQRWQLIDAGCERGRAQDGGVGVAVDLGSWMLLRFRPDAAAKRSRWMATSRRAIPDQGHALRCAVYSPRPDAGAAAAERAASDTHDRP
jgi:hypothetical protein